jgi:hypothetical protein
MNTIRALANCLPLILVACLAVGFAAQREARIKAETEHSALEHQVETLRGLTEENAQLSNLVARANAPKPLPDGEPSELLRLRAEVSELRRQSAGLQNVLEENRRAHGAPARDSRAAADVVRTADYWPHNSWAFAGYATPDATFQSSLWAADQGDLKTVLAGLSGKMRESLEADLAGKTETEVTAKLRDEVIGLQSVRVLDRVPQPDGTVLITASLEGKYDSQTAKLVLEKVGNEWKITGGQ